MMMLVDAFQPEGITRVCVDSIFMMPHLGVLAEVNEQAATEVFERDCLIYLGTCVSALNRPRAGGQCFDYSLTIDGQTRSGGVASGEVVLEPLELGQMAVIRLTPGRGVNVGAGRGRPVEIEVYGGVVGLVLDGRGRPLVVPEEDRSEIVTGWARALDAYPDGA
jgi:hypothetical protein